MSEQIKHECGIAFIRLLKPLEFYQSKYGTAFYGLNKMQLLMEKQHNRGQDGAGMASVKLNALPGNRYIDRQRSNNANPIKDIFDKIYNQYQEIKDENPQRLSDVNWLYENSRFTGELFLGHLRYGTFGGHSIDNVHPFIRHNNWKTRNLVLAGNFNLTNVDEQFQQLLDLGQHPIETTDTVTVLEKIGHFLDEEVEKIYYQLKEEGKTKREMTGIIAENLNVAKILKRSSKYWDGGYVMTGMFGHGDSFILRDPAGIRPAFYYQDDEIVVVASERPAIQTALNVQFKDIKEVNPGSALIVKRNGEVSEHNILEPLEKKACSFERIYFSRGTDKEIYQERKNLGRNLCPAVLSEINHDLENTVFSFIPNTASVAFQGLVDGLNDYCIQLKKDKITALKEIDKDKINEILSIKPRVETIAVKDVKMRTFITDDIHRDDLVSHVYDVTYGAVNAGEDTLIVLDDSIVRGTTLKRSILKILERLHPKKIVIVSSAPQIRYPDCYGIDMAKLNDFIAFRAAIGLLNDKNMSHIINKVYLKAKEQIKLPIEDQINVVREIYEAFTAEEISDKIAEILRPNNFKPELGIIYQSIEDLHKAIPNHTGDWYFTGKYPTPGGNRVVNQSFINYIEGVNKRAY
jgi:amidophosphoribosyltransferase